MVKMLPLEHFVKTKKNVVDVDDGIIQKQVHF